MPIYDELMPESRWRQELADLDVTIRKVRDAPPESIRPALLALDLRTFVKRRDELRLKLGLTPVQPNPEPKPKRKRAR